MEGSVPNHEHCCRLPQDGRLSHAYLHALIENNPTAVVVLDSDHRFQMCNLAFTRLFQYDASELEISGIDALLAAPDFRDEVANATRNVLLGKKVRLRTRRRRKDGWLIDVDVTGVPLLIGERVEGIFGLYQHLAGSSDAVEGQQQARLKPFGREDPTRRRSSPGLQASLPQELVQLTSSLSSLGTLLTDGDSETEEAMHSTRELAALCANQIRSLEQQLSWTDSGAFVRTALHTGEISSEVGMRLRSMTEREVEIVKLLACGLSSKEVAGRLEIGTRTVETHRLNVYRKLQLRNIADLVVYAVRTGLLTLG